MNDEGATHYSGVIENLGLGHRLLNDTFGECALPRVGWQASSFLTDLSNLVIFGSRFYNLIHFGPLPSCRWIRLVIAKNKHHCSLGLDLTDSSLRGWTGATKWIKYHDDDDNNNNNNNNKAKLHKIGTMHCSESNRKTKQEHDHEIDHG